MENSSASSSKAWTLFGLSTVGMLVFATLYFTTPEPLPALQINTNTGAAPLLATSAAPAEIPQQYLIAWDRYQKMNNATPIGGDRSLFKMQDVVVEILLDDGLKKVVSEDEVRAKFELVLRRNNVPINSGSKNKVTLGVRGFVGNEKSVAQSLCSFSIDCYVLEIQHLYRDGDYHYAKLKVWDRSGAFGITHNSTANNALLEQVEKAAESFANNFLNANPKEK